MEVNAADVMATNVVTVHSDASVKEIAETLLANRISAVPVIDDFGYLLGMPMLGDFLEEGLSLLDYHCEEFEINRL
jgi:CBS-domain-containing membrane protein